ncbi:MAG: helix-turn-helix transcriptional regulator [Bacteroidetes bacterium]|nr:helix-turn-helix transcriptional regulator [Bacteroidota bacterium]
MGKYQLSEFEEVVMLTVAVLHGKAYGVAIKDDMETRLNRKVSVGALQTALKRLEQKDYLKSTEGESNSKRGGRPKLYYEITAVGKNALEIKKELRNQLWNAIPQVVLDLKIL